MGLEQNMKERIRLKEQLDEENAQKAKEASSAHSSSPGGQQFQGQNSGGFQPAWGGMGMMHPAMMGMMHPAMMGMMNPAMMGMMNPQYNQNSSRSTGSVYGADSNGVQNRLDVVGSDFGSNLSQVGSGVGGFLGNAFNAVSKFASNAANTVWGGLKKVGSWLGNLFKKKK